MVNKPLRRPENVRFLVNSIFWSDKYPCFHQANHSKLCFVQRKETHVSRGRRSFLEENLRKVFVSFWRPRPKRFKSGKDSASQKSLPLQNDAIGGVFLVDHEVPKTHTHTHTKKKKQGYLGT